MSNRACSVLTAMLGLHPQNLQCTDAETMGRKVDRCAKDLGTDTGVGQSCLALELRERTPLCSSFGRVHGRRLEGQGIWNGSLDLLCDLQLKPGFSVPQNANLPDEG